MDLLAGTVRCIDHLESRQIPCLLFGFANLFQPLLADCEEHQAGITDDDHTFQHRPSHPMILGEQEELSSAMPNQLGPAFKADGLWLLRAVAQPGDDLMNPDLNQAGIVAKILVRTCQQATAGRIYS